MAVEYCVPLADFISALNKIADFVDVDTKDHSRHTKKIAVEIAIEMGWSGSDLLFLGYGADIHDIGKVSISPVVFRQPSKLTRAQYISVQQHPIFGMEMISEAALPSIINDCVLYHHEHYDGSGYPKALKGDEIPMCACITCVADVWESINSDRPYRAAMGREQAIRFMGDHIDWFHPDVFAAFTRLIGRGIL